MSLENLTKVQKQYLVLGVVVAVIALVLGWIGVRLSLASVARAKSELDELTDKIESADATLKRGKYTGTDFDDTVVALKEHLAMAPPNKNYFSWATEEIYSIARNTRLEIDSIDQYGTMALEKPATTEIQFDSYSIRISARGSYEDTKRFLEYVEQNHPLVRIAGLEISSGRDEEMHGIQLLIQWPYRLESIVSVWDSVEEKREKLAVKGDRPRRPKAGAAMVAQAEPQQEVAPAEPKPVAMPAPKPAPKPEPVVAAKPAKPGPVVVAEPKPVPVKREPVVAEAKPEPVPEPVAQEPKPVVANPEPVVAAKPVKPGPVVVAEPKRVPVKKAPVVAKVKPEPVVEEPKPVVAKPEPPVAKPEPEPAPVLAREISQPEPKAVVEAPKPVVPEPVVAEAKPDPIPAPDVFRAPEPGDTPGPVAEPAPTIVPEPEAVAVESNDEPKQERSELQALLASLDSRGDEAVPAPETSVDQDVAELEALVAQLGNNPVERPEPKPVQVAEPEADPEAVAPVVAVGLPPVGDGQRYAATPASNEKLVELLRKEQPKTTASLDDLLDGLMENIND